MIPDGDELARAALMALHREVSFVLYNKDQPQVIAERLEKIDDVVCAALSVRGSSNAHLVKAIQLALLLDWRLWMLSRRFAAWQNVILLMISTMRELPDQQLQSRIFRAWGIFLFLSRRYDSARAALDGAIENLKGLERDDLKLLMHTERFNLDAEREPLASLQSRALDLLAEAERLHFRYIKGRVLFALALAYLRGGEFAAAFMYAQQAAVYFVAESDHGLAAQSLGLMVSARTIDSRGGNDHPLRILAYAERVMGTDKNPWYWARIYHEYGVHYHHRGQYDQAVTYALRAKEAYAVVDDTLGVAKMQHQLGLIRSRQEAWLLAENHFEEASALYQALHHYYWMIGVDHACGWNRYLQGLLHEALASLNKTLELALKHALDDGLWRRLIDLLREDITTVQNAIDAAAD